jgi:hypothetical protein
VPATPHGQVRATPLQRTAGREARTCRDPLGVIGSRPSGTMTPLLGGEKGSGALTGAGAQVEKGSGSGGEEVKKAERQDLCGVDGGAKGPN